MSIWNIFRESPNFVDRSWNFEPSRVAVIFIGKAWRRHGSVKAFISASFGLLSLVLFKLLLFKRLVYLMSAIIVFLVIVVRPLIVIVVRLLLVVRSILRQWFWFCVLVLRTAPSLSFPQIIFFVAVERLKILQCPILRIFIRLLVFPFHRHKGVQLILRKR